MLLSAASMFDHLSLNDERDAIRRSIYKVLIDGKVRTEDLGGMHNFLLSSLHYHCKLMKKFFCPIRICIHSTIYRRCGQLHLREYTEIYIESFQF